MTRPCCRKLKNAITLPKQDISQLIDTVKAFYEQALTDAETVLNNQDATKEDVNNALDHLFEAVWLLDFVKGDKTNLGMLIERAEEMMQNADKYVDTNWQQLVRALEAAKAVYDDGDAMDEDIQPVAEDLLNAILAQRYKANKANLEALIQKASTVDVSLYTAASVQVFKAPLYTANLVLDDETLSEDDQKIVDEAAQTLSDAIDGLEKLSSNDEPNTGEENQDENKGENQNQEQNQNQNDNTNTSSNPDKGPADW